MALGIQTNAAALTTQRSLMASKNIQDTTMQRLSTGMRINNAKDDAAGLAIGTRMGAQIRSLNQAVRNANDGISMMQTAESGMQSVQDMLTRMKELATQGANEAISSAERKYLADEIKQLREEVNNVANRTTFNGINLLNGSGIAGAKTAVSGTTVVAESSTTKVGDMVGNSSDAWFSRIDVSNAIAGPTDAAVSYKFSYSESMDINGDGTSDKTVTLTANNGADIAAQTLDLSDLVGDNKQYGESITLNFDQLGVSVDLTSTKNNNTVGGMVSGLDNEIKTDTGSKVAKVDASNPSGSLTVAHLNTVGSAYVSDIDLSAAQFSSDGKTNTYTFASDSTGNLFTVEDANGNAQTIDLTNIGAETVKKGESYTFNFDQLGVKISVVAQNDNLTVKNLASALNAPLNTMQDTSAKVTAGTSVFSLQVGSNNTASNQLNINLLDVRTSSMAGLDAAIDGLESGDAGAYRVLMDVAETSLDKVSEGRGTLGAQMNRLEYTIQSLQASSDNLAVSRGRIMDADYATESANMSKQAILQQAGVAMLAQANQSSQNVMQLLR